MSTITHENITVDGIPFHKITKLQITHTINSHGTCTIEGEIDSDAADDFIKRADETFAVQVTTNAEGQPSRLFFGAIQQIREQKQNGYQVLTMDCVTSSARLDAASGSQTFQKTSQTYGQMLNTMLSGRGSVNVVVGDKPIGSLIMKCEETDWQFIVRMASQLGAPACANIISKVPQIYIGIPPANKTITLDTVAYGYGKSIDGVGGSAQGDSSEQMIKSYEYGYLGDILSFQGQSYRIKTVQANLVDGILECQYGFSRPSAFSVPKITNTKASGRMMTGIVQAVEQDRVQVFLSSVDSSYDGGGDWWFPYATAYSSQDGSGWYSMPAVGDEVRVFFPSGSEGDAFAASSVAKNVRENVKDKCWSGLNGKSILMVEDGLVITCKESKIYIKMSDEKGIEIISDQNIHITSGANITIQGGETVKVLAENEVVLGTAEAYLNVRKEGISMTGENIIIT